MNNPRECGFAAGEQVEIRFHLVIDENDDEIGDEEIDTRMFYEDSLVYFKSREFLCDYI